ncbi:zinc finger protein 182-like [Clupea harengus]|uniref:Zinc finger protein 182-like n=1 Tax=Clupea harengus TaxID=7950 RepID=A0A6P8F033_CLUHA|nr:zinc finger protein 182-like [Clupea harengus]
MDTCTWQNVMLEQREWKADSKPMLSGQIESNLLLRLHLEDLERRLEEKENKLTAAHETIRALRDKVQSLQEQLDFKKGMHQEQRLLRSCYVRANSEANSLVPVDQPTVFLYGTSATNPTGLSCSVRSAEKSPQHLTLTVSLEDCRHTLRPDGVFKLLERKNDAGEDDGRDIGSHLNRENETFFSQTEDSLPSEVRTREEWTNGHYSCSQCRRTFSQSILLNLHLKMHDVSPFKYLRHSGRQSHSKGQTHELSYSCNQCGKTFSQSNHLKIHQRAHERPIESHQYVKDEQNILQKVSYDCDQCSKTFPQKNYLKLHQRMHRRPTQSSNHVKDARMSIREMTYPCDQCSKTFPQKNYLKLHQRTHGRMLPLKIASSNEGQAQEKKRTSSPQCRTFGSERPFTCTGCEDVRKLSLFEALRCGPTGRSTGERPHLCSGALRGTPLEIGGSYHLTIYGDSFSPMTIPPPH